jgi:hypothetical protein
MASRGEIGRLDPHRRAQAAMPVFIPLSGLIYSISRSNSKTKVCPVCFSPAIVPG